MSNFKDVFISYGRKESKAFAEKLHNHLIKEGLDVWLDQNDIPLGADFQNQIDDGINRAHNFIFIIAPHAILSPYCLKEVRLAVNRRKRIIPILHVEEGCQWDKLHPAISKINWIYMREKADFNLPASEWQSIDNFDEAFARLLTIFNHHKDYVAKHTEILDLGIDWEAHQRDTQCLLSGKEREEAEKWLLTEFKFPEQPPCEPSVLHREFISESKKNAENLLTDVFVGYAIENKQIKDAVVNSLARYGVTTWTHGKDIEKGMDYSKAIERGIEQATNFLFFISPQSVDSEWCLRELDYAVRFNKRIVPLLIEKVPIQQFPNVIKNIQYIDFTDNRGETNINEEHKTDFDLDIDDIIVEFRKDDEYFRMHKIFMVQALKWQRQNYSQAMLLRGYNLEQAQNWLENGKKRPEQQPLDVHKRFIEESVAKLGQLNTEVFISYSRKDGDFARKLNEELQTRGKTTWFDQESIAGGTDFQAEIYKGITQADNFLFVLSPDSIHSPYCADEVNFAASLGKRFITILHKEVAPADMPAPLAAVQWLDFSKFGFEKGISQLLIQLNTDRDYVQEHTQWSQRALQWRTGSRANDLLLRGSELQKSIGWLQTAFGKKINIDLKTITEVETAKQPAPTPLQLEFIAKSKKDSRQRRWQLAVASFVVALIASLAVFAFIEKNEADEARAVAENYTEDLLRYQKQIESEKAAAIKAKQDAEMARYEAEVHATVADSIRIVVEEEKVKVERLRALAEKYRKVAERDAKNANQLASIAKEEAVAVKENAEETKKNLEQAILLKERTRAEAEANALKVRFNSLLKEYKMEIEGRSFGQATESNYMVVEIIQGKIKHANNKKVSRKDKLSREDINKGNFTFEGGALAIVQNETKTLKFIFTPEGLVLLKAL